MRIHLDMSVDVAVLSSPIPLYVIQRLKVENLEREQKMSDSNLRVDLLVLLIIKKDQKVRVKGARM